MALRPPFAMPPFAAGINNQRLAIAGLVLMAAREGRALTLPTLVDYVAGAPKHPEVGFGTVFDAEAFTAMLAKAGLELVPPAPDAIAMRPWDLFASVTRVIRQPHAGGGRPLVQAAIAALRPRPELVRIAEETRAWARAEGATIGCQLRLEKDWETYVERTLRTRAGDIEDVELDHNAIFRRIADTFGSDLTLYVTCDEEALYRPKELIARDALDGFGLRLLWKSAMPGAVRLRNTLERAAVDFEAALGFERFVGTTRSTFFNILTFTKAHFEPRNGWAHYPYNLRTPILVAREDAFTNATPAPAPAAGAAQQEVPVAAAHDHPDDAVVAFFRERQNTPASGWTDRLLIQDPVVSAELTEDLVGPTRIATDPSNSYTKVIAALHRSLRPEVYLEIGVNAGASLRLAQEARLAIGIDPAPLGLPPELGAPPFRVFRTTSDAFFEEEARRVLPRVGSGGGIDLAFIDGLHIFEFVLRDFIGVEWLARPRAVAAVHDVLPRTLSEAARHRITRSWTGDVWRLVAVLARFRPDLEVTLLDAHPTGLGLISRLDPGNRVLVERYDEVVAWDRGLSALDHLYRRELRVGSTRQWLATTAGTAVPA